MGEKSIPGGNNKKPKRSVKEKRAAKQEKQIVHEKERKSWDNK
jgi:hypothetical protein